MSKPANKRIALFIGITIGLGVLSIWFTVHYTRNQLSDRALEQAVLVAQAINKERLINLKGNVDDINSQDYIRLKEQLFQIRHTHKKCRFLYLLGRKNDGAVFFFLDSQRPDSKDYALPGLVYEEVSDEYLHVFDSGQQQTVGPVTDRWGTLITSLVPIYGPENKQIAVLGMDINADKWDRTILVHCMLPASLTLLIVLLIVFIILLNHSGQINKMQYEKLKEATQQVKTLSGFLPICASCKKIRNDKGYWSQVETYIQHHSEAKFSHSICPECAKKLYPELYENK